MIFTTRPYLKYLLPTIIIIGIGLLVFLLQDFSEKTDGQKESVLWMAIITLLFFIGLPFFAFKYLKIIEYKHSAWIIKYPFLNKEKRFGKNNVKKIEIIENISAQNLPSHTQINIIFNDDTRMFINSMELNNFKKIRQLLVKDFRGLVQVKDFYNF